MEEAKKKEARGVDSAILFGILVIFMGIHLFIVDLSVPSISISFWIAFLAIQLFRLKAEWPTEGKNVRKERLRMLVFISAFITNALMFRYTSYFVPQHIFVVGGGLLVIYLELRKHFENKKFFIFVALTCVCISFLGVDHHLHNDNLLKNPNLTRFIKSNYDIDGQIDLEDLGSISELDIDDSDNIRRLDGIENFMNLQKVTLEDDNHIVSYAPLSGVENLTDLYIWNPNLDKISEIQGLSSVETINLLYPKNGQLTDLSGIPNLKRLDTQGVDFDDFTVLKSLKKLECLKFGDCEIHSFAGLSDLENLQEISIYKVNISDYTVFFHNSNLKEIRLNDLHVDGWMEFKKEAKKRGIKITVY